MLKFTKKARFEQKTWHLRENPYYVAAVGRYIESFGYSHPFDTAENRRKVKALREVGYKNSEDAWARIHVMESLMRKGVK